MIDFETAAADAAYEECRDSGWCEYQGNDEADCNFVARLLDEVVVLVGSCANILRKSVSPILYEEYKDMLVNLARSDKKFKSVLDRLQTEKMA